MNSKNFSIRNLILCDDIRTEDNGKNLIIGVYTGEIIIREAPFVLNMALMFDIVVDEPGAHDFRLRMRVAPDDFEVFNVGIRATVPTKGARGHLNMSGFTVRFSQPGELIIELKPEGKDWINLETKKVATVDSLNALQNEQQQTRIKLEPIP